MKNYLCFVVIVVMWSRVKGQSCFNCVIRHPHQDFCRHDFVIKAQVKRSGEATSDYEAGNGFRSHEVKVKKWFKSPDGVEEANNVIILNNKPEQACGENLEENMTYLIYGTYNATDGSFHIPICSFYTAKWKDVAGPLKTKLKRGKYNCDCGVKLCREVNLLNLPVDPSITKEECLESGDDYCTADNQEDATFCLIDYAICQRNQDGKCAWKTWGGYAKCINSKK